MEPVTGKMWQSPLALSSTSVALLALLGAHPVLSSPEYIARSLMITFGLQRLHVVS